MTYMYLQSSLFYYFNLNCRKLNWWLLSPSLNKESKMLITGIEHSSVKSGSKMQASGKVFSMRWLFFEPVHIVVISAWWLIIYCALHYFIHRNFDFRKLYNKKCEELFECEVKLSSEEQNTLISRKETMKVSTMSYDHLSMTQSVRHCRH